MSKHEKEYQGKITTYWSGKMKNRNFIKGSIIVSGKFIDENGEEIQFITMPQTLNDRIGANLRINESSIKNSIASQGTVRQTSPSACILTKTKSNALLLINRKTNKPIEGITLNLTMFADAEPDDKFDVEGLDINSDDSVMKELDSALAQNAESKTKPVEDDIAVEDTPMQG